MNEPFSEIELVYGGLLNKHLQAARKGDGALRERIFGAILVFEELWPTECAHYSNAFRPKQPLTGEEPAPDRERSGNA